MKFNIWTLLFQITNFIVLLVVLSRILYRPVREIMEKRRRTIEGEMQVAESTKTEAQALKDKYETEVKSLKELKARMLEDLQEEMDEERKQLLSKAREDAEKIIQRENALANAEKKAFEAEMKDKILDSVSIFSMNILRDIADETLHKAVFRKFLEGLDQCIREISMGGGEEGTLFLDLSTAYPLHHDDVERIKDTVQSRTGKKVSIASTLEPELIAGVRMKAGDQVIDSSVAGQIRALTEKLKETA
jgi:F-type H+-transporting ATPase subunit b